MRLNRLLPILLLVFLIFARTGYAIEKPPPAQVPEVKAALQGGPPQTMVKKEAPPVPVVQAPAAPPAGRGGQVSLNFDDADVFTVVQTIFGDILRVNYVIDPKVKGRVNFRSVAPVPREKVLSIMEVILRLNGIGVVEEAGLYRIIPIGELPREPSPVSFGRSAEKIQVTGRALLQVIPIQHQQSSDLLKMISPFLSTNAVVVDVPKSNQIIVVDTDVNVKRIVQLVEIFDGEKLRKRAEVFIYPVQNGKAKEVSVLLQQIFLGAKPQPSAEKAAPKPGAAVPQMPPASPPSPTPGAPGSEVMVSDLTKIFADEITNSVVVLATPEDYALIRNTIERIDQIPRQVVIEGVIAQVSLTDNLSLGIAAAVKANVLNLDTTIGLNASALSGADPAKPAGTGLTVIGVDSGGSVRALITALASDSKAKLLAAPHILVSDNREARIQVGQQVPIVTAETYGTPGISPQRVIQYKDIGIILKVKPRVNDGGLVSLELSQEVSTFSTIELFVGEKQIILNKTEATTNLVVQDGQSIVIGGLIREDRNNTESGIPFLRKIPLIGWLFGNTSRDDTRVELVILLTPRVIRNQKEAKAITSEYIDSLSGTSKGGIRKEELLKGARQPTP